MRDPRDPGLDRCRICGMQAPLTREHVPPRAAFNSSRADGFGLEAWLRQNQGQPRGRALIQQGGTWYGTLCGSCNNTTGHTYAPELIRWTRTAASVIARDPVPAADRDADPEPSGVRFRVQKARPGAFLKQVAGMMLTISPAGFPERNPDLRAFVQDPEWIGLPPCYQFYLALYRGPYVRYVGGAARMHENERGGWDSHFVFEIAYPPFSYVLSLDEDTPAVSNAANVSEAVWIPASATADMDIATVVGWGHTPLPCDYRSAAAVARDRRVNAAS